MNHFAEICKSQQLVINHATEMTALPGGYLVDGLSALQRVAVVFATGK